MTIKINESMVAATLKQQRNELLQAIIQHLDYIGILTGIIAAQSTEIEALNARLAEATPSSAAVN